MASFTRRGRSWRAAIKIGATRRTETFATRAAAVQWAAQAELEARAIATNAAGTGRAFAPKTLADLLTRYPNLKYFIQILKLGRQGYKLGRAYTTKL